MKILLSQAEIEQAVREFVSKGLTLNGTAEMTIDFTAGRGENGLTASIDVPYMGVSALPITPQQTVTKAASSPAPVKAIPVTPEDTVIEEPSQAEPEPEAEAEAPVAPNKAGVGGLFQNKA